MEKREVELKNTKPENVLGYLRRKLSEYQVRNYKGIIRHQPNKATIQLTIQNPNRYDNWIEVRYTISSENPPHVISRIPLPLAMRFECFENKINEVSLTGEFNEDFETDFLSLWAATLKDFDIESDSPADQPGQAEMAQDATAKKSTLAEEWAKMGNETKEKFRKAWKIYQRMLKDYQNDVAEKRSNDLRADIQDFRVRVLQAKIWKKISDRRLREVIRLGDADIIK